MDPPSPELVGVDLKATTLLPFLRATSMASWIEAVKWTMVLFIGLMPL
jgi:hypothetical protein